MTVEKITVSLPGHLVEGARRAVRHGRASSVSAYLAEALEEHERLHDLSTLLNEILEETGGPMTREEQAEVDRVLGVAPAARKRRPTRKRTT